MDKTVPCQNSHPDFGTCKMLNLGGTQIHLILEGSGPLVLFVHGSQAWSYAWRNQIQPFIEAGYRVAAVDLPGNGYSAAPKVFDYSVPGVSRLIGSLLNTIEAPQAILVASSAGGLPVLDFAIRNPARVQALILASTCGVPHRLPFLWNLIRLPVAGEVAGLVVNEGMIRSNLQVFFADPKKVKDPDVQAYTQPLRRPGSWSANLQIERSTNPRFVEAHLQKISCPVLLIWGREDAQHPIRMVDAYRQKLPQAKVEILSPCGHLPHEEQPDDFNERVLSFLREMQLNLPTA